MLAPPLFETIGRPFQPFTALVFSPLIYIHTYIISGIKVLHGLTRSFDTKKLHFFIFAEYKSLDSSEYDGIIHFIPMKT